MNSSLLALTIALCILALIGLLCFIEALWDRRAWHKREEAERVRTTGVLVGFVEEQRRYSSAQHPIAHYVIVYHPIVLFQVDGVEYKLKSAETIPREKYREGQSLELLYDSTSPTHFHLDRGDMHERSTRGAVIFAPVWMTCALIAIALILSTNPQLGM